MTALVLLFGPRYLWDSCESKVDQRVSNDIKTLEAVLVEKSCGALTDYRYVLSIVNVGEEPSKKNQIAIFDRVEDSLRLNWKTSNILDVNYDEARILEYRNYYYPHEMKDPNDFVRILESKRGS